MSWFVICCSTLEAIFIAIEMGLYCISPSLEPWNNLEVLEQYPIQNTHTDGKQTNFVSAIREKSPNFVNEVFYFGEWSFLLNISWTLLKSTAQDKTTKTTRVFTVHWVLSMNDFCLDNKSVVCHRRFSEKDQANRHLKILVRLQHISKQIILLVSHRGIP